MPEIIFTDILPDLITPEDYKEDSSKKKIRIRISKTDDGIEILGDSMYVSALEDLLAQMEAKTIEKVLCG